MHKGNSWHARLHESLFVEIVKEGCVTKEREQSIAGEERLLANISKCFPNPANPRELKSLLPKRKTLQVFQNSFTSSAYFVICWHTVSHWESNNENIIKGLILAVLSNVKH